MAHEHNVYNTDEQFLIDPVTRVITQQSGKNKLMQGDHNSERYEFSMNRFIDGHDMSLCNDVKVYYLNVSSDRQDQSSGPYKVTDMMVDPNDDTKVSFSWLISRNATKYAGSLNFNITFRGLTDSTVNYAWHTDIHKDIRVYSIVHNEDEALVEEYIDILEQWKKDVLAELSNDRLLSVNGLTPDENGNVQIDIPEGFSGDWNDLINRPTDIVKSVNGFSPDEAGNVVMDIPEIEFVTDDEVIAMLIEEGAMVDKYSWEGVAASIEAGTYATDYAIGDLIQLDLGTEGPINMQIVAFDTDDLADGSGKAHISFISKELLATSHRMNPSISGNSTDGYVEGTGSRGGWAKSDMRTYLHDIIKPMMPDEARRIIVPVTKVDGNITSYDDVWIPNKDEIIGSTSKYFACYQNKDENRRKLKPDTSTSPYWLRTVRDYRSFELISSKGFLQTSSGTTTATFYAENKYGVALGFCV